LAGVPDWPLIWIKARLLLLAARLLLLATAVPDEQSRTWPSVSLARGPLEFGRGQDIVAAPIERKPPEQRAVQDDL
jgi:hypothetical protein